MRTELVHWGRLVINPRELLAVGIFSNKSRLGERIELLLRRGRIFSPRTSPTGFAASAIVLSALLLAGSLAPRWIAFAQQPSPSFEVISIKPNKSGAHRIVLSPPHGDHFSATNVTVAMLLTTAFRVEDFQISSGPGWLNTDHFDIEAKAGADPDGKQFGLMLRALLADRFQLKNHKETREEPVYLLTVAKDGPKLKVAECVGTPSPANPCGGFTGSVRGDSMGRTVTSSQLALNLTRILGRMVVDRTSLTGKYDIDLHWRPDESTLRGIPPPGDPDAPPADPNGPSIFTAIQEQLGLKLESAKAPIEVLVIDRIERPNAN